MRFIQKQPPEVFYKEVLLKILQIPQENTCVGVSFKWRDSNAGVFLWILRNFLQITPEDYFCYLWRNTVLGLLGNTDANIVGYL